MQYHTITTVFCRTLLHELFAELHATSTSLSRPTKGSPLATGAWQSWLYKIAVLCYKAVKLRRILHVFSSLACHIDSRACSEVIYVTPTVNTVFIEKHCCSSVLTLRLHRLEQSSLIST